ncbi:MAG: NAD(P)-dependent oxidoreductase, partial [Armatimonadota bacterium]
MSNLSSNKIFITGGAGFLGINLVRYLLDKGCVITACDIADFDYPEKDKIEFHKTDIRDLDALINAMNGCDMLVHCAAALPLYRPEDIFTTDIDGTENVLKSAITNNIKRVVFISS